MKSQEIKHHILTYSNHCTAKAFSGCFDTHLAFQRYRRDQSLKTIRKLFQIQNPGRIKFLEDMTVTELFNKFNDATYYGLGVPRNGLMRYFSYLRIAVVANSLGFNFQFIINQWMSRGSHYFDFEKGLFMFGVYAYLKEREQARH